MMLMFTPDSEASNRNFNVKMSFLLIYHDYRQTIIRMALICVFLSNVLVLFCVNAHLAVIVWLFLRPHRRRPTPPLCCCSRPTRTHERPTAPRTRTARIMSTKKSTAAAAAAAATPAAATPSPVDPAQVDAHTNRGAHTMTCDGCALADRCWCSIRLLDWWCTRWCCCFSPCAGEERSSGSVLSPVVRVVVGSVQTAAGGRGGHSARRRTQEDPA